MSYFISLPISEKASLAQIRHFANIKVAYEKNLIWMKGVSNHQMESKEISTLYQMRIYYEKDGKLFFKNSSLPEQNVPSLLWTPIQRAISVRTPPSIDSCDEVSDPLYIKLSPSNNEQEASAIMIDKKSLNDYIQSAPKIRLKHLKWAILSIKADRDFAFVVGNPLLPVQGRTFWQFDNLFIPTGFSPHNSSYNDANHEIMARSISRIIEDSLLVSIYENMFGKEDVQDFYAVWLDESNYFLLPKNYLMPLSRSSFRLSFQSKTNTTSSDE